MIKIKNETEHSNCAVKKRKNELLIRMLEGAGLDSKDIIIIENLY